MADPTEHTAPVCAVMRNDGLARLGLAGRRVEAWCEGATLHLRGDEGGTAEIPAAGVDTLRLGVLSVRANSASSVRFYVAHVVPRGSREPLILQVGEAGARGYAETFRRFAAAMAAAHGVQSVEAGVPGSAAIALVVKIGAGVIAGVSLLMAASLWSWGSSGAASFFALTALVAAGAALAFGTRVGRGGPRPVTSLEQIEAMLPRG